MLSGEIEPTPVVRWISHYGRNRAALNAAARRFWFGADVPEVVPLSHVLALIHPIDRAQVEEFTDAAFRAGGGWSADARALRPDGEYAWCRLHSYPTTCPLADGCQCRVDGQGGGALVYIATVEFHGETTEFRRQTSADGREAVEV